MDSAEEMEGVVQSQTISCYDLNVVLWAYRFTNFGRVIVRVLP
jgi:hypothetical protein